MSILGLTTPLPTYPPHFNLLSLIRPNILSLQPYRCARDDFDQGILLDANENAIGHSIEESDPLITLLPKNLNRYPSPTHDDIKTRIASLRNLPGPEYVFLGVGSDEVIDLVMRVVCAPGRDKVMVTPPTYGMYSVTAQVNDVEVVKVPLDVEGGRFSLEVDKVNSTLSSDPSIKLLFLCSPGNPTGTLIPLKDIIAILENPTWNGLVVVDEAYIDFAGVTEEVSAASLVDKYANLLVSQTLSKGFGLAGIRLGLALASPPLIQILMNIKAPYSVSTPTAHLAFTALSPSSLAQFNQNIASLNANRSYLLQNLPSIPGVGAILGGNHANFLVVQILGKEGGKVDNERANEVYLRLARREGVVVRFRGKEVGCEGCLRVTVGTREECEVVLRRLREVLAE
ncbi:pyridoxal phosphate-dependent transferase [Mrakia frigida]|uniref:histidinol-phosphate transaminase n=1 Tax=Mrakia frigida TaxID=29902 RepID=UPI003FCC1DF4